ncbi:hypothetical protein FS749_007466 [Ceratobasidium sp. UAMH 11750]|nr:hypothetical protein FS749_007466 [Ceratobasidium sp. UAMH 11750]
MGESGGAPTVHPRSRCGTGNVVADVSLTLRPRVPKKLKLSSWDRANLDNLDGAAVEVEGPDALGALWRRIVRTRGDSAGNGDGGSKKDRPRLPDWSARPAT